MKLKTLILALLTATVALAAESIPLFNAILTTGGDHRFVLVNAAGASSKWLKLGESYDGYELKSYDAATGQLEVARDGKATQLTLVNGAAVTAGGTSATSTPATLADAEEMFRVMRFDEMMSRMLEQQKKAIAPMMQRMMAGLKVSPEDQEAVAAFQKKVSDEMMNTMMGPEMRADMAKIYSEVFTKEELGGLTSFYGTPTGQALIDKQPDVQQKMMATMMPRMMQVMPKIQQMGKDFAAEMTAKKAAAKAAEPAPASTSTPEPAK
jgi:hypothetical protein